MLDKLTSLDVRGALRSGSLLTFRGLSIVTFVVLLGLLVALTAPANPAIAATLATFALFFMLRAALPAERIDALSHALMTGEAGERVYLWLETKLAALRRWFPW